METKKCQKCGRELPLSAFKKHNLSADGYCNTCTDCKRAALVKGVTNYSRNDAKSNPELSKFKPRDLIAELVARGYRGKLTYTYEINL